MVVVGVGRLTGRLLALPLLAALAAGYELGEQIPLYANKVRAPPSRGPCCGEATRRAVLRALCTRAGALREGSAWHGLPILCSYSLAHAPQVGPFANPSELYEYYSLPFCRPTALEEKWLDLGEVLKGDRAHKTPYARRAGAYDGRRALCRAVGAAAGRAGDAAWRDGARACPGLPPHAPRPLTSPPVHPGTHRLARNPPRNPPHNP